MLLEIATTHKPPATDLCYLLHKKPARADALDMPFGRIHLFYTEASETRCAFALMLDVNPVALICGSGGTQTGLCGQYVTTALVQRRPSCQWRWPKPCARPWADAVRRISNWWIARSHSKRR